MQGINNIVADMEVQGCVTVEMKSESFLTIEKDLWRLSGEMLLSGVRRLNAEIYEVAI